VRNPLDSESDTYILVGMQAMRTRKKGGKAAARDPARTRESLLQAAFEEMHRSGFRGSDVETILGQSGMTKGAMYHHFEDKRALGYAVVDQVIAAIMREKWQSPLRDAPDPLKALIGILMSTSLQPEHVACGCPLNNMAQEMSPLDEGFRKRTMKLFEEWHGAVAAALRAAKARGTLRKDVDPDETATFLIAAYEGYMSLAKCFQDAGVLKAGQKTLVRYLESLQAQADDQAGARAGDRATRPRPH
jgi:TetR/AcrR family transcriptional repressor of nem operon